MFAEFVAIATEGQWEAYSAYFDGGIPYGAVISAIFIIGLCTYAVIKAKKLYKEL